jgi:hypothetical protein
MDAGTAEILEIEKDNPDVTGWAKCKFIILVSRVLWKKWSDFILLCRKSDMPQLHLLIVTYVPRFA